MTPADTPYLSLVVTARYDDHGGNFMRRMQAFLNAFIEQCQRHRLRAEVLVVEWNPLPDRCGLAQALEWPGGAEALRWCQVRFIEVPPELHAQYRHGARMPLYQMIAKNVALQRARGEWVLATNIDIFFNEPLMSFLAQRELDKTRMYRIDRHDAGDGFPLWATAAEQLAYCENNVLRISAREATFALNAQGFRTWPGLDIVDSAKLGLGPGWYPPEIYPGKQPIRYLEDGAVIQIPALAKAETLVLWMDPGINAAGPLRVRLERPDGTELGSQVFRLLSPMRVHLAPSAHSSEFRVRVDAEWKPNAMGDVRQLIARAWSVSIGDPPTPPTRPRIRALNFADRATIWMRRNTPALHAALAPAYRLATGRSAPVERSAFAIPFAQERPRRTKPPVHLHTNACGDFTLLHRDAWRDLRGYPEFDAYSMNIDSALCWAAHYAGYREQVLADPMRIYHMEHGQGSGWTPEGAQLLYQRITDAGLPWLEYTELMNWVESMHAWGRPILFNGEQWGLAAHQLRETAPALDTPELRWCKDDPQSPSRQALAGVEKA